MAAAAPFFAARPTHLEELKHHVHLEEAGQPVVPNGSEQLLNVRVRHELKRRRRESETGREGAPKRVIIRGIARPFHWEFFGSDFG